MTRLIFSRDQEEELVNYIKFCAKINHGLTLQKIRDLAYEIAVRNNIKKPANWDEKRQLVSIRSKDLCTEIN